MSYCRFSTNDFQCDVYVYAHVYGGILIHVAKNKFVFSEELPPPINVQDDPEVWLDRYNKVHEIIKKSERIPIDLPHAGEDFHVSDPEEAIEVLTDLRELGYRFPDYVIDTLREDQECWEEDDDLA